MLRKDSVKMENIVSKLIAEYWGKRKRNNWSRKWVTDEISVIKPKGKKARIRKLGKERHEGVPKR